MRRTESYTPTSRQSWLSVLATSGTPAAANARTVRADGQDHFSFTSSSAPAALASRREPPQRRVGDVGLGQAHLRQDAEQVRERSRCGQHAGRLGQRAADRLDQAADHLLRGDLAAGDRLAHLRGCTGPRSPGN